jgi:putative membrane protein
VENDTLLLRWRILSRTTVILPRRRIQQAESRRTPFQRRVRLATFAARVASGGSGAAFDLQHMDDAEANRLLVWFAAGRRTGTTEL